MQPRASRADVLLGLCAAADHFNAALFQGKLPLHTITFQRGVRNAVLPLQDQWQDRDGSRIHEIALNPTRFVKRPAIFLFQALVSGQCSLWQYAYGRPSRPGYFNREWVAKMRELGFSVTVPGAPGQHSGQRLELNPLPKGRFVYTCAQWAAKRSAIAWLDRGFAPDDEAEHIDLRGSGLPKHVLQSLSRPLAHGFAGLTSVYDEEVAKRKRKVRYQCSRCFATVWGKEGLSLTCKGCNESYREAA